jgi:GNAT superfamily N-acetyltransferase
MYKIIQTEIGTKESDDLFVMFVGEWPDFGIFETKMRGISIPNPILVLDQNAVIGGASFTGYKAPDTSENVIWLNALFVDPEYRKQGIATSVIEYLGQFTQARYALTDIPELYIKCGWTIISTTENGTVVKNKKYL